MSVSTCSSAGRSTFSIINRGACVFKLGGSTFDSVATFQVAAMKYAADNDGENYFLALE